MQVDVRVVALALSAIASAEGVPSPASFSQCTTPPIQCCDNVKPASSITASLLLAILGVVVEDHSTPIGVTCSPIADAGEGGGSCSEQTVCCGDNSYDGVIAINCAPVDLTLPIERQSVQVF
ncbi:hypothetical protein NMY22_g8331 [Coprinellus aureogranulatus]|nr:hypothetical protein NMY22_g8331 [Coprinellus aureogranulatus]